MITNKNIDEVLKKQYFQEIKDFYKRNNSAEERISYIRDLYGHSGWGIPDKGDFIDGMHCDSSGIEFIKTNSNWKQETMKMKWNKVAERLQKIIENESQLSLF
ncbi:hypothetical protein [Pseudoleptotrichia goodfellowii]|uniref:Uncharacterized protein n=1 Tax=Pseudoleptotrichia goodfellowii F0264 TaxID=596323 RepID=D0GNZ5_9FUSO|nr:hypothetical protein [Pseudoleptotrichia goodfellowii]EEY34191.1 hypothetical protein HMPREF0554_0848 [Pseudoleptotrichia goodfellowii F0264]